METRIRIRSTADLEEGCLAVIVAKYEDDPHDASGAPGRVGMVQECLPLGPDFFSETSIGGIM
jgi:hypothetical protein